MDGATAAAATGGARAAGDAHAPKSLELVLATNEVVNIDLDPLPSAEELEVVVEILTEEKPPSYFWTALAARCWNVGRRSEAELIVARGCSLLPLHRPEDSVPVFALHAAFQLAHSRSAPKQILPDARYQPLADRASPKQHYFRSAIEALNQAQSLHPQHPMLLLVRGEFALVSGDNALAAKLFDAVLAREPAHPVALLGRACTLLRARQYVPALQMYQRALRVSIKMDQLAARNGGGRAWAGPDARVGIGLCLDALGHPDAARRAWRRAADMDEGAAAPRLLLGVSLMNLSRQAGTLPPGAYGAQIECSEEAARRAAYAEGLTLLQRAWALDKTNAMAAVGLCTHLLSQASHTFAQALPVQGDLTTPAAPLAAEPAAALGGSLDRALKLGEHAIQYADTKSAVVQAWLLFARALHMAAQLPQNAADHALPLLAQRYYTRAQEELARPPTALGLSDVDALRFQLAHGLALATLGLAQLQLRTGDTLAARNTLDAVLMRPAAYGSCGSFSLELGLLAALLYAQPLPGATPEQREADGRRARVLLDRTLRLAEAASLLVHGARSEDEHDQLPGGGGSEQGATVDGSTIQAQAALESEHLAPYTLAGAARLGKDPLVYAQLAALCSHADQHRAVRVYAHALRLAEQRAADAAEASGEAGAAAAALVAQLQLNLGALLVLHAPDPPEGEEGLRRGMHYLERTLRHAEKGASTSAAAASESGAERTAMLTALTVLARYDLGRALEKLGDVQGAHAAYDALLAAHPEYVDARVRLAVLAAQERQDALVPDPVGGAKRSARDVANALFKAALSSEPANLDTRATYMRFLAGAYPANRHASWAAVKETAAQLFLGPEAGRAIFGSTSAARHALDEARHDAYTLAVLGWAYYQLALHTPPGANQRAERAKGMVRAADLLDKALAAHPQCAFAAQGLAILLADDALSDPAAPANPERRRAAAEEAIALFGKLREVRDDASVYICLGHAFMIREELERALNAYELALRRYGNERSPMVLQYLARAEYALGLKERDLAQLQHALEHLHTAREVLSSLVPPSGADTHPLAIEARQVTYNMAVMAQKALQMLYELPATRKSVTQLETAIGWVTEAQEALRPLQDAAQRGQLAYITAEVVEQRIKYAEMSLLRQASKQLDDARAFQEEERARKQHLDEKQRAKEAQLEQLRREKEEEHRRRAEAIAESRKRAREEASQIEYLREPSPEREPRKRAATGGGRGRGGRRKKEAEPEPQQNDRFVVESSEEDEEGLFREESDEDEAGSSESDAGSGGEGGEAGEAQAEAAKPAEDEPAAPSSTRAKLEALAKQRKQRAKEEHREKKRSKKRSSTAGAGGEAPAKSKKVKVYVRAPATRH